MTKEQRELVNAAKQIQQAWFRFGYATSNMTKCINRLSHARDVVEKADKKDNKKGQ